jgi:hypothetical protein
LKYRVARVESDSFMKPFRWLGLLTAFALISCTEDEPPVRHRPARYPSEPIQGEQQPQPFNPNQPPSPPPETQPETTPETAESAAPTRPTKGDYPYGIQIPGEPGFVMSPYSPGKKVDVRGMPPGTEVKDPYTDYKKIFIVP